MKFCNQDPCICESFETIDPRDSKISDLEAKLAIAIEALAKISFPYSTNPNPNFELVGRIGVAKEALSKLQTHDASPIETRAQTEERVWNEAKLYLWNHPHTEESPAYEDAARELEIEGKRKGYIK